MATTDTFVDDLLEQVLNLAGGMNQADLYLQVIDLAQKMKLSQQMIGQTLLDFIRAQMADPFSIVPAVALYGQAGGGTLAPAAGFEISGGMPSPYGPLFDELMKSLSDFAMGNFEIPVVDFPVDDGGGDGGDDDDAWPPPVQDPVPPVFDMPHLLERIRKWPNVNSEDALWFLQFADYYEKRGGGIPPATLGMARRMAFIINGYIAGTIPKAQAEEYIRQMDAGTLPDIPGYTDPEPTEPPDDGDGSPPPTSEWPTVSDWIATLVGDPRNIRSTHQVQSLQYADHARSLGFTNDERAFREIAGHISQLQAGYLSENQFKSKLNQILNRGGFSDVMRQAQAQAAPVGTAPMPSTPQQGKKYTSAQDYGMAIQEQGGYPAQMLGGMPSTPIQTQGRRPLGF